MWLYSTFFKDFRQIWQDTNKVEVTFFVFRIFFISKSGAANFKIEGKVDELIDLFAQCNIQRENRPAFIFKICVNISDEWK